VTERSTLRKALLPLARALAEGRRAWLRYEDGDGVHTSREVDVLGLAWRGGPWHLAAFCHTRKAFRLFRLDRVVQARVLRTRARRGLSPPGFDARFFSTTAFLEPGTPEPPVRATVRLHAPLSRVARALFPAALRETSAPGVVLCHMRATRLGELARLVASLGEGAELCHPDGAAARASGPAG
jgi:predicted DNA-binding transcriptional regulator YafY